MITEKEFRDVLDGYFVEHPDNEALLELEWCTGELEKSIKLIGGHCRKGTEGYHKIVRSLLERMERIYSEPDRELSDFARKAYAVWEKMPGSVDRYKEPLADLSYVKPPVAKKKEKWAEAVYCEMFDYYRNGYDKPIRKNGKIMDMDTFLKMEPGMVEIAWGKVERLLGFSVHDGIKDFYSRAVCPSVKGSIDFTEQNFLIPTGVERFDQWFRFHNCEGKHEIFLYPLKDAGRAERLIRDAFFGWTGGNNFGHRVMIGKIYTNIGDILILLNNDTGEAEWIDCGYGHYKTYKKNPNGILAKNLGELCRKLLCYSVKSTGKCCKILMEQTVLQHFLYFFMSRYCPLSARIS